MAAFKHWCQYLEGAKFPVQVLTDHRSLEYFTTTKQLNCRQARLSELLVNFDFVIQYRPGAQAGLPDALTHRFDIDLWTSSLLEQINLGSSPTGFTINSINLLTYKDAMCVPDVDDLRLLIAQDCHNSPSADMSTHKSSLPQALRSPQISSHSPYPWSTISMDLIEQLPASPGFTTILVVVDCLTKMATFIPTTNKLDAPGLANLFLCHVYSKHGLPTSIISDHGSEFTSHFWCSLSSLLGIENHFSSMYHPQSDGQTECVNQVLEQYLWGYSNHLQTNWSDLLPLAEFSYNNPEHASTQLTPFFANYGYHPCFSFDNQVVATPAPHLAAFEIENDIEYEVERILDSKINHRYCDPLFYLVRWAGYWPDHNSCVPNLNLTHASDLIVEFHIANPNRLSHC
ncbi:uncharacterized protein UHOD_11557 [Ustilago sp. UG-2017b]|nr:uncharacterized protein UHOD_11557 [Ustilago sp. UG-2017b]